MPEQQSTKSDSVDFQGLYDIVDKRMNADYDKVKSFSLYKITFRDFRKVAVCYLDILIKESIDSLIGKQFLYKMGRIQVVGIPHTKKMKYRNKKPLSTARTNFMFYTMVWKTKKDNYKIYLDKYYKKKIFCNIFQKGYEYLTISNDRY